MTPGKEPIVKLILRPDDTPTMVIDKVNRSLATCGMMFAVDLPTEMTDESVMTYTLRGTAPQPDATALLLSLSAEQRVAVFGQFCTHCGRNNPNCRCWDDE